MLLNILLIVAIILAVLIVALLAFAALKPDTFRVERTATISAPAEKIFPLINDFHRWTSWSPWENIDPALKRTYSGPDQGKGATYDWLGNKQVGQGRMEILESLPPTKVLIKLDFIKPFEAHHSAEFTLTPRGNATDVNWAMDGRQPFMLKVMTIFMSMDKMVGKDFEKGLANLKTVVET